MTYRRCLDNFVGRDNFRFLINLCCHALRGRTTVGDVVLDAKVVVWAARIVTCGEQDAAGGFVLSNDVGSGGS